jgi:hypothetical protein
MRRGSLLILAAVAYLLVTGACVTSKNRSSEEPSNISQKLRSLKADGPRKRVVVLPVINDSAEKAAGITKVARDVLVSGLKSTDNYIILDNSDLGKDLESFKKESGYDLEGLSKIAAEAGVIAIIEGRVIEVKARKSGDEVGLLRTMKADVMVTVGSRVFASSGKREVFNEVRSAQSSEKNYRVLDPDGTKTFASDPALVREALASAFNGFVLPMTKTIDKLAWAGRIALIQGEKIYLNAGRLTGINVGDILKVMEPGDDIYDPETGLFIGKAPGRVKGTLEIVSYFGKDGGVGVIHSGSGFKENDRVELY